MKNKYKRHDPRYWLLESPGKWLLYIFALQATIFYATPSFLSLLPPDTVISIKEFCISILNSNYKHLDALNKLDPSIILSGFIFWLIIPFEVVAVYYMLSRSGRDLAFPSLFNKTAPDMRGLLLEEMFMDRRKYSGKTKVISLKRRVFGVISGMIWGLILLVVIVFMPELLFVLEGTNTAPVFQDDFLNMFTISLFVGINLNLIIIPVRDVFLNIKK